MTLSYATGLPVYGEEGAKREVGQAGELHRRYIISMDGNMTYIKYEKRVLAQKFRKDMTEAENVFWQHIRDNRFDKHSFRRQVVIEGFIVDFYCRRLNLVIEINGGIHETTKQYDNERAEILERHGLTVLTFTNDEVLNNISNILSAIRNYATTRNGN